MRALIVLILLACAAPASAEGRMHWYRGFYTRVGIRDVSGAQERFHAWAMASFGIGYRYNRGTWGVDASALNLGYDPEEGIHTVARVAPYLALEQWIRLDAWVSAGLSYGWIKGTVDEAIAKRRGEGLQGELIVGCELPRVIRVRAFVQLTATLPFYNVYDMYHSRDSVLYVYALEAALGIRF